MADTIPLAEAQSLVARARTGDLGALEHVFRAYERSVYTLARRLTKTPEDAEDVLQETFLEVVKSIGAYRGDGHLWGWVRQIAASKALMKIRRETVRAADEFDETTSAGTPAAAVGTNLDLERALETLTETGRAVVWMHDVEGYTHEEIAEMMGKTVSFSKSQLARSHARLRKLLAVEPEAQ